MPADLQVITQSSVSIYSGSFSAGVVQLARDALNGYRGDYYFFQYSDSEYVLLMADSMEYSDGTLLAETYDALIFHVDQSVSSVSLSESGSVSGNAWGTPGGMQYNGSYSGSLFVPVSDYSYRQAFYSSDQDLSVTNSNHYLAYGSFEGLPHLVEGSEHYAYAEILLLLSFFFFVLVDRIFKHIGN